MILRDATSDDEAPSNRSTWAPWVSEVAEIVVGLIAWPDDADLIELDRRVIVAEDQRRARSPPDANNFGTNVASWSWVEGPRRGFW